MPRQETHGECVLEPLFVPLRIKTAVEAKKEDRLPEEKKITRSRQDEDAEIVRIQPVSDWNENKEYQPEEKAVESDGIGGAVKQANIADRTWRDRPEGYGLLAGRRKDMSAARPGEEIKIEDLPPDASEIEGVAPQAVAPTEAADKNLAPRRRQDKTLKERSSFS